MGWRMSARPQAGQPFWCACEQHTTRQAAHQHPGRRHHSVSGRQAAGHRQRLAARGTTTVGQLQPRGRRHRHREA